MGALAYFLTWTTYGTWLPGDARGWGNRHRRHGEIIDGPSPVLEVKARSLMYEKSVVLNEQLRACAETAMREACSCRGWHIHALEIRSNHVHVVVSAPAHRPGQVMGTLKAYASRAMNTKNRVPRSWWTRQGSKHLLHNERSLHAAIRYVESQDISWMTYF